MFSFLIGCSAWHIRITKSKPAFPIGILIILILLCCIGTAVEHAYAFLMIAVSLLSGLYLIFSADQKMKPYRMIDFICRISYPLYLVQFPIIYIFNELSPFPASDTVLYETILIILVSMIITYGTQTDKNSFLPKKLSLVFLLILSGAGMVGYITCPDYYKQMEELKEQLAISEQALLDSQKEFLEKLKTQKAEFKGSIGEIDKALENIDDTVRNTQLCFIGDSVMLGGSYRMHKVFNNYYCDAKGSRGGYLTSDVLQEMIDRGILGDYLIIHMGTNWGLELSEVEEVNAMLADTNVRIFWLNVTNNWRKTENPMLADYCSSHERNYLIDWYAFVQSHPSWLKADGIHLSDDGRLYYDQYLFENIKAVIISDLEAGKVELQQLYESEVNAKPSIYGNGILSELYDVLNNDFVFHLNTEQTFEALMQQIDEDRLDCMLTQEVFVLLDESTSVSAQQLSQLCALLEDRKYYIFGYGFDESEHIINLRQHLSQKHYAPDGIHLSEQGRNEVSKMIKEHSENTLQPE